MPRTPMRKPDAQTTPVLETRPSIYQSQTDMLDLLDNLKLIVKEPFDSECAELKSIHEQLEIIEYISQQHRPEMLRNIETWVSKCDESDPYESVFKWSEQILCTLKQKPYTIARNTAHSPVAREPVPTLKSCRKHLDQIVSLLKSKWKDERLNGYPKLRSGNRTSSASKKLAKSLPKYETYIIKTLWGRWTIFENKCDRIRDQQELQKLLHGTQAAFVRVLDALQLEQVPKCPVIRTSSIAVNPKSDDPPVVDEPLDRTTTAISKSQFTMTIFEPSNPTAAISSAHTSIKHFEDTGMIGLTEISSTSTDATTADNATILCGNPKWLSLKHRLAEKGVLFTNGLHISLPVHRADFQLGAGNFGPVEFAFDSNVQPIALKRLTECGRIDSGRADCIRRRLDELKQLVSVRTSQNLLITSATQDMCGFAFCHAPLCDFNLSEYVSRMLAPTNERPFAAHAMDVMHQIVHGLGALHLAHSLPIVHGNLKPNNVLVTGDGVVKLADFGVSAYLYERPDAISTADRMWWAVENHSWLKALNTYSCTTMADIYSCGLLLLYVFSGGRLPSNYVVNGRLTPASVSMRPELYQLLEHMLDPDPIQRPAIIEIHNHINFWSERQRTAFVEKCTAMVNTDNAPLLVERPVALAFCATLQHCWTRSNSTLSGLHAELQRCSAQIQSAFGAMDVTVVDSPLSALKLLARCRHTDEERFQRLELIGGPDNHPQLACVLYDALLTTPWFQHEQFRAFSPFAAWDPVSGARKDCE